MCLCGFHIGFVLSWSVGTFCSYFTMFKLLGCINQRYIIVLNIPCFHAISCNSIVIWISLSVDVRLPLSVLSVKFGVLLKDKNLDFLINNWIILCKHFILHRYKFLKIKPHFSRWRMNKIFVKSLHYMKLFNALNLFLLTFSLLFLVLFCFFFMFLLFFTFLYICCSYQH